MKVLQNFSLRNNPRIPITITICWDNFENTIQKDLDLDDHMFSFLNLAESLEFSSLNSGSNKFFLWIDDEDIQGPFDVDDEYLVSK